ncbi:glycosyltransferase [Streptomyces himalayensis]|uniref:Glycosyltransferase n=1 Tax=Streptomyces himalayensis subsp. himalayensis TaxID=2756131 RepID=A0A7W0DKU0_9ACTN|nr:glycosyltransferase [Streptomyces himalayensis]MBA2946958.1 glycosyltransferase [Streptomyces himalayensis subsp. himalayensis]
MICVAQTGRRRCLAVSLVSAAALTAYAHHHLTRIVHEPSRLVAIDALAFCWLAFTLIAAHTHRDVRLTGGQARRLDDRRVTVVVPVFNEDPKTFRALLESVGRQSRLPQRLHVVDNGSTDSDCRVVFDDWVRTAPTRLEVRYDATGRVGKRRAQAVAFDADPEADIFCTVDSDTVLDPHAIREGIAPFSRADITSVAGLLLGLNHAQNLLTRLVDLSYVMSFLNGRSSTSRLGSVVVNCGGLAFYRADVVRKYQHAYVTQTVWGRPVSSGDDRMLTGYSLLEGRTVIQERSVAYTLLPDNLSHLTRQRLRWWRSFFWGGGWLIRTCPVSKPGWWLVLWQFAGFVLNSYAFPVVLIVHVSEAGRLALPFLGYVALLSYLRSMRYFTLRRPDQTRLQQLMIFTMAPFSTLLNLYVCTVLQYAGLATFLKTGWSTRQTVEVSLGAVPEVGARTVPGAEVRT